MRESKIQKDVREHAETYGWQGRKLETGDGDPDYMFDRGPQEILFIEFKQLRKKPRPNQIRKHRELRSRGFRVEVIDNTYEGKALFDSIEHEDKN